MARSRDPPVRRDKRVTVRKQVRPVFAMRMGRTRPTISREKRGRVRKQVRPVFATYHMRDNHVMIM